jgi:hypothetical protein
VKPELQSLMFQALTSPFGIEVRTSSPEQLRQKLYAARKLDATFAGLSFIIPPTNPESILWIIKREANHGTSET